MVLASLFLWIPLLFGGGAWSPLLHFSLSTYILSTTFASVGGCYHYSKVDLSTPVELTLHWIPSNIFGNSS
jgi:hypothetical protein